MGFQGNPITIYSISLSHYIISSIYSNSDILIRGCSDDVLPWSKSAESELDTKYMVAGSILVHSFEHCIIILLFVVCVSCGSKCNIKQELRRCHRLLGEIFHRQNYFLVKVRN